MENTRKELLMEKIRELLENEQFCEELAKCEDVKAICDLFNANGLEITEEEVSEIQKDGEEVIKALKESDGELDLDQLDAVDGGGKLGRSLVAFGGGLLIGGLGVAGSLYFSVPAGALYAGAAVYSLAAGKFINGGKKKKKK